MIDTFKAVRALLAKENDGRLSSGMIQQYADLFCTYREATLNISRNGAIVTHPKTGAPIENPYLKVRQQTLGTLRGFSLVKATTIWDALTAEVEAVTTEATR